MIWNWHGHCYARASTFFNGQRTFTVIKYLERDNDRSRRSPTSRFLRPVADLTQAPDQATGGVNFALPDDHHPPPDFPEFSPHDPVSFHIPLKLPAPEIDPCLRHVTKAAALVPVPETAVNQNNRPVTRQNNIGAAGQVRNVEAKPVAKAVEDRANRQLRLGVAAANA